MKIKNLIIDTVVLISLASVWIWPGSKISSYFTIAGIFLFIFLNIGMALIVCAPKETLKEVKTLAKMANRGIIARAYDFITDLIAVGLLISLGHYITGIFYLCLREALISKAKELFKEVKE